MADTAYVAKLPNCDHHNYVLHTPNVPAEYDARTRHGQWANLCQPCWEALTDMELGTGKGQRLVVGEPPARDRQAEFNDAAERGDIDAMSEAVGDGDPADFF